MKLDVEIIIYLKNKNNFFINVIFKTNNLIITV